MGSGTVSGVRVDCGSTELSIHTVWYQFGSAYGTRSPKASRGGSSSPSSSSASSPGATERVPASATGFTTSLTGSGGGGAASTFLLSKEPTWSFFLYFFRMLSLWYFQKGLEASLPLKRCRTEGCVREGVWWMRRWLRHTLLSTCTC